MHISRDLPIVAASHRALSFRARMMILSGVLLVASSTPAIAQNFGFPSSESGTPEEQKTPFEFEYFDELLGTIPEKERERLCGLDKVCVELWKKGKLQIYKEGRLLEGDFNGDGVTEQAMILETDSESEAEIGMERKDYWIYISQPDEVSAAKTEAEKGSGKDPSSKTEPNAVNSDAKTAELDPGKITGIRFGKTPEIQYDKTESASKLELTPPSGVRPGATSGSAATTKPAAADSLVKGHKILLHELIPDAFNVIDFFWDPKRKGLVIDVGERLLRSTGSGITDPTQMVGVVQPGVTQKIVVVVTWNSKTNRYDVIVPVKGLKHRRRKA